MRRLSLLTPRLDVDLATAQRSRTSGRSAGSSCFAAHFKKASSAGHRACLHRDLALPGCFVRTYLIRSITSNPWLSSGALLMACSPFASACEHATSIRPTDSRARNWRTSTSAEFINTIRRCTRS